MTKPCGCCEGTEPLTPEPTANRPGLDALSYRVGTHATFLETMKAALSSSRYRELGALTTRESDDPAIALLDAWATVADVLTFYQERIANEGYLRTAAERLSILELARLVGYRLHPGVAASVHLAFTLDKDQDIEIPAGTRAQSTPGPGELPQAFETSDAVPARTEWNALKPRQTRPQHITVESARTISRLYLQGTATDLAPNAPLLFAPTSGLGRPVLRYVAAVEADHDNDRTEVTLQGIPVAHIALAIASSTKKLIARYTAPEARPAGTTADGVVNRLAIIERKLTEDAAAGVEMLRSEIGGWRVVHSDMPDRFTTLKPWLGDLVRDLGRDLPDLPTGAVLHRSTPNPAAPTSWMATPDIPPTEPSRPDRETKPEPEIQADRSLLSVIGEYDLVAKLLKPPSIHPASSRYLVRSAARAFDAKGDTALQLVGTMFPLVKGNLYQAVRVAGLGDGGAVEVHALRTTAPLFGHNAPKRPLRFNTETGEITEVGEWPVVEAPLRTVTTGTSTTDTSTRIKHEQPDVVYLDAEYDKVLFASWIAVATQATSLTDLRTVCAKVRDARTLARAEYGLASKSTRIELGDPENPGQALNWITADLEQISPMPNNDFQAIRQTVVHAQSEQLSLAEMPISTTEEPAYVEGDRIELDALYDGLKSGRWLIVSGERTDAGNVGEVAASELVMLSGVEQSFDPSLPGDTPHTTLTLANALAYTYRRDTATIYGNVAKATHGETREEVLGSGKGGKALQQFALKQSPLTHVAAPTPSGVDSTLALRVNDVLWHEAESMVWLGPHDRGYITQTNDDDRITVTFGDGEHGARLPSGPENVKAAYRSGIGKAGNVAAEQISMLATKPLGVKGVINPLRASGGADRESREQARRNVPLAVMALDRLVSVQDYADFAQTFAGIGKASAVELSDGRRQLVHLTIAGADDIPIDRNSDLYRNLLQALRRYGDPYQSFQVDLRELLLLVVSAQVRLLDNYLWDSVEPQLRGQLLDSFSFERRDLGQHMTLSAVQSVIQGVEGVAYSDVDLLETVSETEAADMQRLSRKLARLRGEGEGLADVVVSFIGEDAVRLEEQGGPGRHRPPRAGRRDPRHRIQAHPAQRIVVEKARIEEGAIRPAQLAMLSPELPDTLILTELT